MPDSQESNQSGLRYEIESSFGVLPGSPVWKGAEPNSYDNFGASIVTTARQFISDDRQERKGVTTDVDGAGGFEMDITQTNMIDLFQAFFMRNYSEKPTTKSRNAVQISITAVDDVADQYEAASGLDGIGLVVNHLILAENFGDASNNGLKKVTAVAAAAVDVAEDLTVADGSPAADAMITAVGYEFDSATLDVDATPGAFPQLVRASGTVDFTTIGLARGHWIWIGGDGASTDFVNTANNGFARVRSVTATSITLDKTDGTMVDETGTGLTIQIFFAHLLPNATQAANTNRRSIQFERTLGDDGGGTQSEYLIGAVPNQMSINIPQGNKVTANMSFVAKDAEQRTGATGLKSGTRPALTETDAFNTSSNFTRLRMALVSETDSNPSALFAFLTELTLSLNNNIDPNKAVAVLGAFEMNTGILQVGGSATAYFSTVSAISAVRNNSDVTIDLALVKNNAGYLLDIPLLTLGDGRPNLELNRPITLPLNIQASKDAGLGHTVALHEFKYLPTAAQ